MFHNVATITHGDEGDKRLASNYKTRLKNHLNQLAEDLFYLKGSLDD